MQTTPSISEKKALAIAINSIKAKKYDWEIFGSKNPYPKAELLITPVYKNYKMAPIFKLVYKFEITAIEPFSSDFVYIDAITGDLVIKSSKLHYANDVQATAQTRYSGNQTIWTNVTDDPRYPGFTLLEKNISGRQILTVDNNHNWSFGANENYFLDADNFWSAIEWHNTNQDDVALDIHWANEKCFDYFKTVFNRIGYNNNSVYPGQGNSYHWGVNNPNAVYYRAHSSDPSGYLLFGDGNANYNPFGSLDVYAHEYAHGFFDFAAYGSLPQAGQKENGAIQESLSNIWSSIIEAWAAPTKNHWLGGEEVVKNAIAIDDYSYPNNTLQPDTYLGLYWKPTNCSPDQTNDYCGVHTNAGVMQYWYYLLCNGGSGVNDISNAFAVSGIGIDKVAQIIYRTEVFKTNGINISEGQVYYSWRQATINAAIDLYGANSCEVINVINAWYAVGVGTAFPFSSQILGDDLFCNTSNIFTVSNLPAGTSVIWSVNPSSLVTLTTSGNSAQLTRIGNGDVILTASIINGGCATALAPKIIHVGTLTDPVQILGIPDNYLACNNSSFNVTTDRAGNFTWDVLGGQILSGQGSTEIFLRLDNYPGGFYIGVSQSNACGLSSVLGTKQGTIRDCGGGGGGSDNTLVNISPNPANGYFMVSLKSKDKKAVIKEVIITNKTGIRIYQQKFTNNQATQNISLFGKPIDIYTVQVFDGKEWRTQKLSLVK